MIETDVTRARRRSPTLFAAAALTLLAACQSPIRRPPAGAPRIEVEVVYDLDPAFFAPFAAPIDRSLIVRAVRDAVDPWTDVGLRFYPVASELYGPLQQRPEYVMHIRGIALDCVRTFESVAATVSVSGAKSTAITGDDSAAGSPESQPATTPPVWRAVLRSARAEFEIRVERRRELAPRLTVASVRGEDAVSPGSDDVSVTLPLLPVGDEVNQTVLHTRHLQRAVEGAVRRAIIKLQEPIDRELQLLMPAPTPKPGGPAEVRSAASDS